jgi:hypothetical protein
MGKRGPQKGTTTKPPASGRQKGTPNKRTSVIEAITKTGCQPAEVLCRIAQGKLKSASIGDRIHAASVLLDRLEPRLKSVEYRNATPPKSTHDYKKLSLEERIQLLTLLDKAETGDPAPDPSDPGALH